MSNNLDFFKPYHPQNDIDFGYGIIAETYSGSVMESFSLVSDSGIVAYLQPDVYSGADSLFDLSLTYLLTGDSYSGENFSTDLSVQIFLTLDASSGQENTIDLFTPTFTLLTLDAYSGEENTIDLSINLNLSLDLYTGTEFLSIEKGNYLKVFPNSSFSFFSGHNTYSTTSSCLTLDSSVSTSYGINAGINLPSYLDLQTVSELNIRFKRSKAASWSNDTFTNAELSFFFFPNWLSNQIIYTAGSNYDRPLVSTTGNGQTLVINFRYNNNAPVYVRWIKSSSSLISVYLSVISDFTTNEINGTDTITLRIVPTINYTTIQVYGSDGSLRQEGSFTQIPNVWANTRTSTTNDIFLIHYHNNLSAKPEVLCDIEIYEKLGIISLPFNLLSADSYSGEYSISDLSIVNSITADFIAGQETLFDLSIYPSFIFDIFNFYSGEELNIGVNLSFLLILDNYTGQENSIDLTLTAPPSLSLNAYSGQDSTTSIAASVILLLNAYSGQYSDSSLSVFLSSPIVVSAYSGQETFSLLSTSLVLNLDYYSGQDSTTSLSVYPSIPISAVAYSGEESNLSIQLGITFPSVAYSGEELFFDITYVINYGSPSDAYSGEEFLFDSLSTESALPLFSYSGEELSVYLGTIAFLSGDSYSGVSSSSVLTLNPPDLLSGYGYSGNTGLISLSTRTLLPSIAWTGANQLFDLTINVPSNLQPYFYSGSNFLSSLQVSFQLATGRAYSGSYSYIPSIGNEPNIFLYSDENVDIQLSTAYILSVSAYTGQICSTTLQVGKSFNFGEFRFPTGCYFYSSFNTIYHADLYVLFRTSIMTQVDMGSATYFDLGLDTCCGPRKESLSNNLLLHLSKKDYLPEYVSFGYIVNMSVELSCRPRFSVEFRTGSYLRTADTTDYFNFTFYQESHSVVFDFEADLTHRLCKGYFIPNGNWLVVELNDVLPENCYSDFFYTGTILSCNLSDSIVIRSEPIYSGESILTTLTVDPPWAFKFEGGQRLETVLSTEQALSELGRAGEVMFLSFYNPPYLGYSGCSSEVEITIEYKVRFLEDGCFDNQFVFQNDSGDEIPELFNPVPVEGEPFYHSILGQCF